VEDQQLDLVDAELAGALLEGVEGLVVAVVVDPDLGLDEDLGPVDPGCGDRFADLALVGRGGGGVDEPVAGVEGGADGIAGLVRWGLEDAEAEGGMSTPLLRVMVGDVVVVMVGGLRRSRRR
jgi:hypothetical protein